MDREKISRLLGFSGMVLLVIGAMLYMINSPNRPLILALLVAGLAVVASFIILNFKAITVFSKKRSSQHGANMFVLILLFICIVVIIQAISSRHSRRFDLTSNKRFSLAGQTTSLLKTLDKKVEIFAFYRKSDTDRMRAEDLISQYAHQSEHIRQAFYDPDQKPRIAEEMGITDYGTTVVKCGDKKELITILSEESLTNAILKVFREKVKTVYIVQGHGEKDPGSGEMSGFSIMRDAIDADNYSVSTLSLFEEEEVPQDAYLLLIGGPTKDYFESEVEKIEKYLSSGKNAIFMIDPRVELPNLEKLIAQYNIELEENIVIDPFSRIFGSDYMVPVVSQYEQHPITKGFDLATFYPIARSVRIIENGAGATAQYLAKTGKSAWGETDLEAIRQGQAMRDENDVPAPVPIAAVSSRTFEPADLIPPGSEKPESKIVVFGDSDFASNSSIRISGNSDFLLNTISFLAEEEDLISIRPKQGMGDQIFLTASQGRFVFLVTVALLPLAVLSIGTSIFIKRRKSG